MRDVRLAAAPRGVRVQGALSRASLSGSTPRLGKVMTAPAPDTFRSLTGLDVRVKIVDVGASPLEGQPPYHKLMASGDADIVGFEPNPEQLANLEAIKGPTETYLPFAVGDGARHTLNFCQAPGMTSLLEPNPAVLGLFHGFPDWGRVISTEEVDTVRLDDVPETAGVDMIKIDIQGGELSVLSNAVARLKTTLVIQTEVEFLPLYVDQPLFSEVEIFLRSQGFMFHTFHPISHRAVRPMIVNNDIYAGLGQMLYADAVFVKDFTRLAMLSDQQLLKMAALLHDCYGAADLVLHLLGEHDKRTSGSASAVYLTRLRDTMG
jgi:FkbM family methyltransferase